ncbi:hypothetical protein XELAEV_18043963mg [Xenopus laevis]|uniref:Uncharacterized protein n=1 Tax=Xenopus laevis TaxID=8355 RepID=A0A974BXW5_XENLA|nr:hypothetical protein XELAEV_18043963mg [Xenopus laevis]
MPARQERLCRVRFSPSECAGMVRGISRAARHFLLRSCRRQYGADENVAWNASYAMRSKSGAEEGAVRGSRLMLLCCPSVRKEGAERTHRERHEAEGSTCSKGL